MFYQDEPSSFLYTLCVRSLNYNNQDLGRVDRIHPHTCLLPTETLIDHLEYFSRLMWRQLKEMIFSQKKSLVEVLNFEKARVQFVCLLVNAYTSRVILRQSTDVWWWWKVSFTGEGNGITSFHTRAVCTRHSASATTSHLSQSAPESVCTRVSSHPSQPTPESVRTRVSLHPSQSAPESVRTRVSSHPSQSAPESVHTRVSPHPSQSAPESYRTPYPQPLGGQVSFIFLVS